MKSCYRPWPWICQTVTPKEIIVALIEGCYYLKDCLFPQQLFVVGRIINAYKKCGSVRDSNRWYL